jgi:cation diffusion facilitator CzcD-associated flavoprotein CzcO
MTAVRAALAGKRVAVVGTGASAAQIVPAIVDKVWQWLWVHIVNLVQR